MLSLPTIDLLIIELAKLAKVETVTSRKVLPPHCAADGEDVSACMHHMVFETRHYQHGLLLCCNHWPGLPVPHVWHCLDPAAPASNLRRLALEQEPASKKNFNNRLQSVHCTTLTNTPAQYCRTYTLRYILEEWIVTVPCTTTVCATHVIQSFGMTPATSQLAAANCCNPWRRSHTVMPALVSGVTRTLGNKASQLP